MSTNDKVDFYKVKEVARKLSVSEFEVRRLVDEGTLHKRYIGTSKRYFRITAQSYENYFAFLNSGAGK